MAPRGKDRSQRKGRSETAAQKASRIKKTSETRAKNKKAKEAEAAKKAAAEKAEARNRWKQQLGINNGKDKSSSNNSKSADDANGGIKSGTSDATIINNTATTTTAAAATADVNNNNDSTEDNSEAQHAQLAEGDKEDHDIVTINNPSINSVISPDDVFPNLDYDKEKEKESDTVDDKDDALGIQEQYVTAIQTQIQSEVSKDNNNINNQWLTAELRANDWWIRKERYGWFIRKWNKTREKEEDKLQENFRGYYRDVKVWLPDEMWPTVNNIFMPYCPTCKSNARVGPHCFRDNHPGRVIVGLYETYYVVGRRYKCHVCEGKMIKAKQELERVAKEKNLKLPKPIELDESQYTFMGWDQRTLGLLPYNKGSKFPAFLTHRAGVDKREVLTKLVQDVVSGKGYDRISKDILEYHTEHYTDWHLEYEYGIKERNDNSVNKKEYATFSEFKERDKYCGIVPTGQYLQHVHELHHESIRPFRLKEVKKRGARYLHIDASYKEAKHLCRVRGASIFKALVTVMNEIGEVRMQFHVYTDSHEQLTAALEAFKTTTESLGLPPVKLLWTDNPTGDYDYFVGQLPSLKEEQERLDDMCKNEEDTTTASDLPSYDYGSIVVYLIEKFDECNINRKINAMLVDMKEKIIGLDAEWNCDADARGMPESSSKILTIQIAYRNRQGKITVFIFRTGKWNKLPARMGSLLCNDSVQIAGVNVSGDLKRIGKDFNVSEMKAVEQKTRPNVHNLGTYARQRDVIQDAKHGSMVLLGELVLGIKVDKSQQVSDWSGQLSEAQKRYAAEDAAISLELYEKLKAMPDLTLRLKVDELVPGKKVDLVPQKGSSVPVASLNTRAATATLIGTQPCPCPPGIVPKRGTLRPNEMTSIKPCANSYVVQIDTIHAPGLIIPGYKMESSNDVVSVGDIGKQQIVVPIGMLRNHVDSIDIRPTPARAASQEDARPRPSPPAVLASPKSIPSKQSKQPQSTECDNNGPRDETLEIDQVIDEDENDVGEHVDYDTFISEECDAHMNGFTSQEISWLEAAVFGGEEAASGGPILPCNDLEEAPLPQHLKNRYSVVLGDIFHAMNRTRVPVKHEAKKAYFNALRNAFLIWNPRKVEEFESKMRNDGKTEKDIEAMKYFSPHLYDECVERYAPAPRIMYYRVRAVYTLFGNIVDSKTKKPLFNTDAWKKANQVLKEIRRGYYSDPPGVNLYSKKLRSDGTVMRNKYGMELIECFRGTNRVEAYHRKLVPSVKSKNFGVKSADYLLDEIRHRHNHNISEMRREGFPKLGHYSTEKIDQLQELCLHNHGCVLYPGWISASAYKSTDETLDTIALHHSELHTALKSRHAELGKVSLTKDLQYMCDAMDVPLPLLPFTTEEENQLFARMMVEHKDGAIDYGKMAVDWCKHVDPKNNIQAKLPCHLRVQATKFDRNVRIRTTMEAAKRKRAALKELQEKISPVILDSSSNTAQEDISAANIAAPTQTSASSRKRKSAALGLSVALKQPAMPRPFLVPPPQALHAAPYVQHGGMIIGHKPITVAISGRVCTLCERNGCPNFRTCPGRSSWKHCVYFNLDDSRKNPPALPKKTRVCRNCGVIGCKGVGGHKYCTNS